MKRFSFLLMMLVGGMAAYAQQPIYYTYDAAGNRISNSTTSPRSGHDEELQSEEEDSNSLDFFHYHVYAAPNPTRGYLQVQVTELQDGDNCILSLFDVSGRKILSQTTKRVLTTLDLTALDNGLYLLRVDVNEEYTTIKIVRES